MDFLFLIVLILLTIIPHVWVRRTYSAYSEFKVQSNQTGEDIVREMLRTNGVVDVSIHEIGGELTDHYDSRTRSVNLSYDNFNAPSVASIAVAAHEAGHALQDHQGYFFLRLRQQLTQSAIVASKFSWICVYLGFLLYFTPLIWVGVILLGVIVLFDLITLPVEIDASKRARAYLVGTGKYTDEEIEGVSKVLSAAAFTYIAVTLAGVLQLIRLLGRLNRD